jgi:hypothetical protein
MMEADPADIGDDVYMAAHNEMEAGQLKIRQLGRRLHIKLRKIDRSKVHLAGRWVDLREDLLVWELNVWKFGREVRTNKANLKKYAEEQLARFQKMVQDYTEQANKIEAEITAVLGDES